GYCGTSSSYCGKGCQSEFGICDSSSNTTTRTTKTKTTSTRTSSAVSTNGRCGSQYGSCPSGYCCSKYGYCGTSSDHCGSNCQSEFGQCGSAVTTKTKTYTTKTSNNEYISNAKFKYYHECKDPKHWALSFDDGPYKYDNDLLDLLKEKGVKATFFLNGDNVMDIKSSEGRAIVKRMYNEGHVIGSHTWSHANLEEISKSSIISEMTKLEDALYEIIGKKPALMRPPYGAGNGSDTIASILGDLGYEGACIWNVDTLDWSTEGDIEYALDEFRRYIGKPIMSLNHCYYHNISKESLINLAEAEIDYMLSKGYTPVTMDVCLG
ncbi:glycoside hydrolase/deacetylase, partial [Neocallimastix californiae]